MPELIPMSAMPNQTFAAPVASQNCQLNIYQKTTGLYMDVFLNGSAIIRSVICQDRNRIIRDAYLGFAGDFLFWDTQGTSDPIYTELGGRYRLLYISVDELAAFGID